MRGKGWPTVFALLLTGITPAYAGKSALDCARVVAASGSPPRMRGKGFCQALRGFPAGITPAYAGKRRTATGYRSAAQDHPRVCGEKREPPRASSSKYGSPPRMRGKVIKRPVCVRVLGITPAYAGKSIGDACPEKAVKDHPRICGEKLYAMKPARAGKGSPPHMRGKDWAACCAAGISGITPAYAGKRVRMKAPLDSTVGITPAYAGKRFRWSFRSG